MTEINQNLIQKRCDPASSALHEIIFDHLCTNYALPIFPNHRPVRSLQAWWGFLQTHLCTPKPLGVTLRLLSLAGMVPPSLTNSHMACTHSQEGPCPNPQAQGWGTLVSLCLVTPVHRHPTHPWLVMEEHLHPCQGTQRSLHQIPPCRHMEEASLEEAPCQLPHL